MVKLADTFDAEAEPRSVTESVKSAAVGDQPSSVDRFGFDPYVVAVSKFLSNEDTRPPLTVSIEGEWGSGKSSFMLQLKRKLKAEPSDQKTRYIWFSPWRHDKQESMWAAFAMECSRQLLKQLPPLDRQKAKWQLMLKRFDWSTGLREVIGVLASLTVALMTVTVLVILLMQGVDPEGLDWVAQLFQGHFSAPPADNSVGQVLQIFIPSAAGLAGLGALFTAVKHIGNVLQDPFRYHLAKHLKKPNYADQITFLQQFNNDFKQIVETYSGHSSKVIVFVDDLDRCEVPKAAELMKAINLMIGTSNRMIFILAMDREKVAAGLAVTHKDLLEFLPRETPLLDTSPDSDRQWRGLRYGYAFIEKFVQVAFRLPMPTDRDIERFLDSLNENQSATTEPTETPTEETDPDHDWKRFSFETGKDSNTVREVTKMVAPALDNNPRRLIQFINSFRLKAFVAHSTGLFNQVRKDGAHTSPLSFWQLGKFAAIGLKWPTFLIDLDDHRHLFEDLEYAGGEEDVSDGRITTPTQIVRRWNSIPRLMSLIMFGLDNEQPHAADDYRLSSIDLNALLAICPEVERPQEPTEPTASQEGEPRPDKSDEEPPGPPDIPPDSTSIGSSPEPHPEKPEPDKSSHPEPSTRKKATKKKTTKKAEKRTAETKSPRKPTAKKKTSVKKKTLKRK